MYLYLHQHSEELCETVLHGSLHKALLNDSHRPMKTVVMVVLAVRTLKHSRKCHAFLVMSKSLLVQECSEGLWEALLQDSHCPTKVVPVKALAVRTLKHSRKPPCHAFLVMSKSLLVQECSEGLWEALLQDSHRPTKVVPVKALAVRSLRHSRKSPHSACQGTDKNPSLDYHLQEHCEALLCYSHGLAKVVIKERIFGQR